ncbi:MAG: PIN domain-containing protein [Gammaproteobacteria bacterium]|nr:PIN domain-containing protein [Gammaproteobacteria bacterium]MDE0514401.1 PIN domain-containing protein [Gammaproteobacteria bacterium]
MYLIDTNVISEAIKGRQSNRGVKAFFRQVEKDGTPVFTSVVTIGELRRGIERMRRKIVQPPPMTGCGICAAVPDLH